MCTFMNSLPKKSKTVTNNKKRSLVLTLKPCPTETSFYRFRLLAFNSASKNDRDDPHIIRYVHQVWGKNAEKGYPVLEDEITCPVTPHVHVEGNRYSACKVCDLSQKYFVTFKESNWKDKEACKKNKEFGRKYQAIVPVYVVADPVYDGNNGKFKALVFNDKKFYTEFRERIQKQLLKTPVFNGQGAVDLFIHVSDTEEVRNEGQPNEYKFHVKKIDKYGFTTKPYDIAAITKETVDAMGFDEEFYTESSSAEILEFYNKHCVMSNDDIPMEDQVPVYSGDSTPKAEVKPADVTNDDIPAQAVSESVLDDLTVDPDNAALEVPDVPVEKPATPSNDIDNADDLLKGLDL